VSPTTSPAARRCTRTSSKGDHKIDAGMPESFNVLVKENRSLASTSIWERF